MTALPLTEAVWLVGSPDAASPAFTDPHDCAQYLVRAGDTAFLIDAGTGLGIERMLANVAEVIAVEAVEAALLTHYHADHAGGAAALADAGVPVRGSAETVRALASADEEITQLRRARRAGVYPADLRLRPVDAAPLSDGDELPVGDRRLVALAAPGHCDGHLAFVWEGDGTARALFSGDVIFAGGEVSMQAIPDCRLDEYADTVIGFDELGIDQLFPGHGAVLIRGASVPIGRAAESFRRLVPPPNLLPPFGFDTE